MVCFAVVLTVVALTNGCGGADQGTSPCVVSSPSGPEFEVRGRGAAVEVSERTSDGDVTLASMGKEQAGLGSLVVSSGDAGDADATIVVLGPSEMTRVSISGRADVAASVCKQAAISAAAILVGIGSSVTVVGYDADDTVLFERYTTVTESGGVVAPIGSPPTT